MKIQDKKFYHLITSLGIGGAQKTLRCFINSPENRYENTVIGFKDELDKLNLIFSLRLIYSIPNSSNSVLCCWMYHSIFVGLILKLFKRNITVVLMIRNGLDSFQSLKITTLITIWLSSKISFLANKSIYCSSSSMKSHLAIGYTEKNATFIYNGIRLPVGFESILNDKVPYVFSTVARYEPQKGYKILLDALSLLDGMIFHNRIRYIIYGENTSNLIIPKFSKIDVEIYDPKFATVSAEKILNISSYHVLPSLSEGFANINLEALSRSNFIICSATGDSHVFPEDICYTFPISDFKQLANIMFKIVNSPPRNFNLLFVTDFLKTRFSESNFDTLVHHSLNA
jgi:glycosyltransferase involved in cell wall biosynthesis